MAGVNELLDLALWKDPKKSGAVFGFATTLYVLFERLQYTALSLVAQTLLALVFGSFLWQTFCRVTNRPAPGPLRLDLSEAAARAAVAKAMALLNKGLVLFHKLSTGADHKLLAQTALMLFVCSKVGSWFSFVTLAYMVTFAFFTLPKLYESNQADCDKILAAVQAQLTQLLAQLPELPKAQKVEKKAD